MLAAGQLRRGRFMQTLRKAFPTAGIERKSRQHLNHRITALPLHTESPGSLQQPHYLTDHLIDYQKSSCLHYNKQEAVGWWSDSGSGTTADNQREHRELPRWQKWGCSTQAGNWEISDPEQLHPYSGLAWIKRWININGRGQMCCHRSQLKVFAQMLNIF